MTETVCYDCGRTYPPDRVRCRCGEPTWFDVDVDGFEWPTEGDRTGVRRYADVLPVDPVAGLSDASGGTPLVRADRLDEYAGCRLFVKDEGQNPTGSFKDRGSAVGVAWAARAGHEWVGTVSHGNMAMSMAAHAADRDLGCVVLVPSRIPADRLGLIAQYDPEVLRVEGNYGRLYYDTLDVETEPAVTFVNSDAPTRVAGQKTVAFEICEAFAPETPDAIVLPVSSGGHASAVWKALGELVDAGAIARTPRIYLAQAEAVAPIARAFRRGEETVADVDPAETVAFSISNGSPPSGNRALAAARRTGGGVRSVSEDAILEATERFATRAGLCVEPACATTLAAIRDLTEAGEIDADERVVAIATGTGFKESTGIRDGNDPVDVTLDRLEEELAAAIDRE
ncbi:threonine synthase [Halorubrum sp. F4]|uniref:threonine synthase n=1 Tax=Halorubrum sp. F4 TaxID=2989715 RepID=UPI0024814E58|nr:threonine synthase [Halorubrum sp. F4]